MCMYLVRLENGKLGFMTSRHDTIYLFLIHSDYDIYIIYIFRCIYIYTLYIYKYISFIIKMI